MCHGTEHELSALQVGISEENKLNATTQQCITAKISGSALKQWSKTPSSLRQSNLPLQNEAALISRRIRAVEQSATAMGSVPSPGGGFGGLSPPNKTPTPSKLKRETL